MFTSKFKDKKGRWKTTNQVHIQIMTNQEKQESSVNVALMRKALQIFKTANEKVTKCVIRSDNAG